MTVKTIQPNKMRYRCDRRYYAMIKYALYKGDPIYWNDSLKTKNPIWLEGVDLSGTNLRNFNLFGAEMRGANLSHAYLEEAYLPDTKLEEALLFGARLRGACLINSHLCKAKLVGAHLEGADLSKANLTRAKLSGTYLIRAKLSEAILNETKLMGTHLEASDLSRAELKNSDIKDAYLNQAILSEANLSGARMRKTHLQGANFEQAIVDSQTIILDCQFDEDTDFKSVGLDNCRIDPRLKASLRDIIRKKRWQDWYKENEGDKLKSIFMRFFWRMSNYGGSTLQIMKSFAIIVLSFAILYWGIGLISCYFSCKGNLSSFQSLVETARSQTCRDIGIIANLFSQTPHIPYWSPEYLFRSIYFSIITMTTLGFGDMYAIPGSWFGYLFLCIQVMFGYIILGALITRVGILFSQEAPSYPIPKAKKRRGRLRETLENRSHFN